MLTRECTEKIEKEKKNCLLVSFQPQWNVTDKYFFFTSLHLKSESTLGM